MIELMISLSIFAIVSLAAFSVLSSSQQTAVMNDQTVQALAKMTIMPARRLEKWIPAVQRKGRISAGADADVVVFDADRVIDEATYEASRKPLILPAYPEVTSTRYCHTSPCWMTFATSLSVYAKL